ncbi:MAG: response regulator, partial [Bacteroidales bacterium]|nr:response regulator [Bacteroidales bacterium]
SDIPSHIFADKPKLTQILSNLLSNAIKFTNTGEITLLTSLIHDQQSSDSTNFPIRIEVRDTGVGIKKEFLDKLFKPFFQIDDEHIRSNIGTGLGLSICKQLAELMGGTTGVDSIEGKGSSFWFTFIAKHANSDPADSSSAKQKTSFSEHKSLNVLVVEDNTINRKVIEIMLSFLGHNVSFAHNGQMALDIFKPDTFDIILMDIEMPVLDGVSATRILKEKYDSLPPIVGLSANALEGDREKYINLGMDDYLTKPLSEEDSTSLLNASLKKTPPDLF